MTVEGRVSTRIDSTHRSHIALLYNNGEMSQEEIAEQVGITQSGLSRELKRGCKRNVYDPRLAERTAKNTMSKRLVRHRKVDGEVTGLVTSLLERRYSPQQISVTLNKEHGISTSRKAIYNFIKRDEGYGGNLGRFLRRGGSRRCRRRRGSNRFRIQNRVDISERPEIINNRERYGDWEADLIEGAKHSGYLLSLIERKSRFGILRKLENKKSDHVADMIVEALKGYRVQSITYDNGTEFAKHEIINQAYDCISFFCKPYASWEKGGVENFNGLVRDYYPKKLPFLAQSQEEVRRVAFEINERPKEVLGNAIKIQFLYLVYLFFPRQRA